MCARKAAQIYGRHFKVAKELMRPKGLTIFLFAYRQIVSGGKMLGTIAQILFHDKLYVRRLFLSFDKKQYPNIIYQNQSIIINIRVY